MRLLVLYEELAAYFMACVSEYSKSTGSAVLIIAKKPNASAPFELESTPTVEIKFREDLSKQDLLALAENFAPEAVFSGGWGYLPYRSLCKRYRRRIPVLVGFDNWWTGGLKQRLLAISSPFTVKKWYNCAFVPGSHQKSFALRLGFNEDEIRTGAYCCDTNLYSSAANTLKQKAADMPKRFLFIGRYAQVKGIEHLWDAFEAFHQSHPEWELWCAGKGEIPARKHAAIRHFGFVQPAAIQALIADSSVFILPSNFEPWGVVIHEMAIAGMPQITTPAVGAAERFVTDGTTGFIVDSNHTEALIGAMKKMAEMGNDNLFSMATNSQLLGASYTTHDWASQLLELLKSTAQRIH